MNYIDFETFSETPIKHGTYAYVSTCEPMICTYALGDTAPVQLWDITMGAPMPGDLRYVLDDPDELFTAHSSMFDRNVLRYALRIEIPIPRWRDTLVKALCHGLPGGLDILCQILNVPIDLAKHKDGRRLINLFCKPRPKKQKIRRATRETHPKDWQQFCDYAVNDISSMREVDRRLPSWNYSGTELALWHLDQRINDRGICVDVDFANAAIRAVAAEQERLGEQTLAITDGEIASTNQRDALIAHIIEEYGVDLPDMQMATLERRIDDPDLPPELRELLSIRLAASSTSASKYKSIINAVMPDGRFRGGLQFSGAQRTQRWAGRTFQPHNMPRPDMPHAEIEFGIECIKAGAEDLLFDDVMRLARNAIRGLLIAPPGRKLCVADQANVEGRGCAFLAGEEWKLQAFRDYDAGSGPDLYKVAYARAFNTSPDFDTTTIEGYLQRQIGKVMELMLQYQGGVGAFVTGAATYGIDLDTLASVAWDSLPPEIKDETISFVKWYDTKTSHPRNYGLSVRVREVCNALKIMWRYAQPRITSLWPELEQAVRDAITYPGKTFECRLFKIRRDGAWLRIRLPSGSYLCYPSPQIDDSGRISYMGMNQYSHKWQRIHTYGGKLLENATQKFSGDLLKANMPEIEATGYDIVLTVHDEVITESLDTEYFSGGALAAIMAKVPSWAPGLPLAAKGFSTYRYRKD